MLRSSRALRGFLAAVAPVSASSSAFASTPIFTNGNEMSAIAAVSSAACKAVRGYAAKGSTDEHVEVPLPMYGVAGKYASALYISAVRKNVLEPVEAELQQVRGAAETNPVFADFLKDPSVSKTVRVKAIVEIFKNTKFNDVTKNFLAVLAENGRLSRLPQITSAYTELLLAHRGEVLVVVTAALELTKQELEDIKNAMKGYLKPGQTLKIEQKVDRSIIGGIVVDIQDKHIDLSIDTKIRQMEKLLAELV
jgi:F-type H+-transporting ATPase subunit O